MFSLTGGIPPDGTPVQIIHTYKTGLVVFYYILAAIGVVLAIVCGVFNFVYRKRK